MALDDRHDLAVVLDIGELLTRKIHVALGGERLLRVGKLGEALPGVIEEGKDALVVVEHEDPVEHLPCGVDDTDSLGKDLGASDLSVEPAFVVVRRVIDQPGLEGHGHEIGVHETDDVGIGEDHLTGESGVPSATRVVDGPVDEHPEQDRLVLGARLLQTFEQAALPGDLAPGNLGCFQGLDVRFQCLRESPPSVESCPDAELANSTATIPRTTRRFMMIFLS